MIRRAAAIVLAIYWIAIFAGTHTPVFPRDHVHAGDKLLHFTAYAGLAFLLSWTLSGLQPARGGARNVLLVVMGYGLVDELTQMLVPRRTAEVGDWVADVVGGLAGLILYRITVGLCWGGLGMLRPRAAAPDQRPESSADSGGSWAGAATSSVEEPLN